MTIRFLTATAEAGKDGIGDYTLRLARECELRGHGAEIIAFNDRQAAEAIGTEKMLRLPIAMSWKERAARFESWVEGRARPQWTSLQFAPYALDPKGIVRGWTRRLQPMITGALQVMFHEIWIGQDRRDPLKKKAVGALQRICVCSTIRRLSPKTVHTSNDFYASYLSKEGISATVLPLFGNVPFRADENRAETESELLKKLGFASRSDAWIFVMFGTLHPVWPAEPLLSRLVEYAAGAGKRVGIVSVGRIGSGEELWKTLEREYAGRISFARFGELPAEELTRIFQAADFGIATTAFEMLGKSGTSAAMLEHGLPVVVNRFEQAAEPAELPAQFISPRTIQRLGSARRGEASGAGAVAERFLADLEKASG